MDYVGHVQDLVSAADVSDAGQKSMEHLDGIMLACSTEEEAFRKEIARGYDERKETIDPLVRGNARVMSTYSEEKCAALFARIVRTGIWQVPTVYKEWSREHDRCDAANDARFATIRRHSENIGEA